MEYFDTNIITVWKARIGKFCHVSYASATGAHAVSGELLAVLGDRLILKNLKRDEEYEVAIPNIINCKITRVREEDVEKGD